MHFVYFILEFILIFNTLDSLSLSFFNFDKSFLLILQLFQFLLDFLKPILPFLHNLIIKHTIKLPFRLENPIFNFYNLQLLFFKFQFLSFDSLIIIINIQYWI